MTFESAVPTMTDGDIELPKQLFTDKGYDNQRAVLDRRASDVEALFAERCGGDVIELPRASSG